jgi:hypothetical protein
VRSRAIAERSDAAIAGSSPSSAAGTSGIAPDSLRVPIDRLQHHFTRSHIDVQELELRMLRVKKAKTAQEIERVFADLPPLAPMPPVESKGPARAALATNGTVTATPIEPHPAEAVAIVESPDKTALALHCRPETKIVSIMSSNRRDITLRDGEMGTAVAVMGEATLFVDCSQLSTGADGVAELKCVAVMGGLVIYVKAGVEVEAAGVGVLGYFERWGGRRRARKGPLLRITGAAILGGVKVIVAEEE